MKKPSYYGASTKYTTLLLLFVITVGIIGKKEIMKKNSWNRGRKCKKGKQRNENQKKKWKKLKIKVLYE